jgi:ferredoxin
MSQKNPLNADGRYYVTEYCLACESCQFAAPDNFCYDEQGQTYVFKQPVTLQEEAQCYQALLDCPTEAIRDDGQTRNALVIKLPIVPPARHARGACATIAQQSNKEN